MLSARSPQQPTWPQGFKTFLKWQNVYTDVYFNVYQCLEQAVFHKAASVMFFIISHRNAEKGKQSLFKVLFFFSLFKIVIPNLVWFSECLMLVWPLNGMLIIPWACLLLVTTTRYGKEAHLSSWALHEVKLLSRQGLQNEMCSEGEE